VDTIVKAALFRLLEGAQADVGAIIHSGRGERPITEDQYSYSSGPNLLTFMSVPGRGITYNSVEKVIIGIKAFMTPEQTGYRRAVDFGIYIDEEGTAPELCSSGRIL